MKTAKTIKSNQEQALAFWVNYLNQVRLNKLMEALNQQDKNLSEALEELDRALKEVNDIIISNRGGDSGIHGFLAEILETGINNARRLIDGKSANMEWLNDNGPIDLMRDGIGIQQKFYQSDGLFSLNACAKHFKHDSDFLEKGQKYQIPKDQYEKVIYLYSLSEKEAYKQLSAVSEPTISQWRKVHSFFESSDLKVNDFESSHVRYDEAQRDVAKNTLSNERDNIQEIDKQNRDKAYQKSKPSLSEGAKTTVVSASIEGLTTFCLEISKKLKTKKISEFNNEDWTEITKNTGFGFMKGGVRGPSMYLLSNYTVTPTFVASSVVTASFGIAEQVHLYRNGKLSDLELIETSEILCLEASVSALSSLLGQVAIPIPVIGAMIGNTIGNIIFQVSKNYFEGKEQELFAKYIKEQEKLDKQLDFEYSEYIALLNKNMEVYLDILEQAFAPDVDVAFNGSILLAKQLGVPSEEILEDLESINAYFG